MSNKVTYNILKEKVNLKMINYKKINKAYALAISSVTSSLRYEKS